ncbi:protein-(glutamine-N5) methyltransferase, release factor-specific [Enterococcus sp. 10A9_DIV0425]|uniref:Release factor glutamine methyltransferase n=1 Tax=Candidatus Enterococcus wittei TaxID=1987383 RepID=A0A242JY42_9ENTE|nr:peptide chain release factor N(5)-glutamine methyltransferase [Enterococcus sp. 10A9_DIV0425]OTP10236.1 protein-(glutamine-N5) methyltransferase, release factor-specific [Enterococcus sp. 10A9_DIV0425]THE08857.1 peptide chain release factor N(5)-glutamine methyltransferase [Enterococcus hirae]
MDKQTYREVLTWASSFLEEQGIEGYSIQFLFLERKQWKKIDWLLHMNDFISDDEKAMIEADLQLLLKHYPPHYVLGYTDFYGHRLLVTEDTLIPRPETEELVELCLQETSVEALKVVDIGTGTGAIAISLKAARKNWHVSAIDLSKEALAVAKKNAEIEKTEMKFYQGNTLEPVIEQTFDVIIANPPYISVNEWDMMDQSVRTYEPKLALFAEEEGLAIYKKIAKEAKTVLAENGKIFLEIGFKQGLAVKKIFQEAFPKRKVVIKKDMAGNDRMIYVTD